MFPQYYEPKWSPRYLNHFDQPVVVPKYLNHFDQPKVVPKYLNHLDQVESPLWITGDRRTRAPSVARTRSSFLGSRGCLRAPAVARTWFHTTWASTVARGGFVWLDWRVPLTECQLPPTLGFHKIHTFPKIDLETNYKHLRANGPTGPVRAFV